MSTDRKRRLAQIIFGADTPAGKRYDIGLILVITASVTCVMLDSVRSIHEKYDTLLTVLEWIFTVAFTVDYLVRIWCSEKKLSYVLGFWGLVDLLSVIPTYVSLVVPGSEFLATLRFLRVMRMFRVLKLSTYEAEYQLLLKALRASGRRIVVFLCFVLTIVVVLGSLMYTIEGTERGFTSIPRSIYWAVVTLTTVGYGDISPQTPLGQAIAALIMILGYSIIVIPTGIVASSVPGLRKDEEPSGVCKHCGKRLGDHSPK